MGLANFTGSGDNDHNSPPPSHPALNNGAFNPLAGGDDSAVEELLVNYNERFKNAETTLFRDKLIEQVLAVLIGKNKPNVLLVGPAGVGKTRIVEDIARRIALGDSLIPDQLNDHTIFELPISDIVAGTGIIGTLETKVKEIVEYAADPKNKVVLFMDEVHQLVGGAGGSKDGTYAKIAQILKPAMARGDIRMIGATTTQEARSLDTDPAFNRRFSRLIVDELTSEQTYEVLTKTRPGLLAHYDQQITVSDDVLAAVVRIADTHSRAGQHRPDNTITLLDRAMADRVLEQKRLITQALNAGDTITANMLQTLPNVPLTENRVTDLAKRMLTGNADKHPFDPTLLHSTLLANLKGQDRVLDQLVDRLVREELGLFPRTTPIAWMFAGASGVGKTEAAKIIAEQLTGQDPIVLNMAEYHTQWTIERIIGAPPGYIGSDSNAELPFDSLESNPRRVILLDEFEKCDPAVQRLFLSALDEGYLTTSQNKRLDFSKALVIATTNAAREALENTRLGFTAANHAPQLPSKSLNKELAQFFDAELLGRFSLIVGFQPITPAVYRDIVAADYAGQRQRIAETSPRMAQALPAAIPDDELSTIEERTHVPSQGARPARRAVRAFIENTIIAAQAAAQPDQVTPPAEDGGER